MYKEVGSLGLVFLIMKPELQFRISVIKPKGADLFIVEYLKLEG